MSEVSEAGDDAARVSLSRRSADLAERALGIAEYFATAALAAHTLEGESIAAAEALLTLAEAEAGQLAQAARLSQLSRARWLASALAGAQEALAEFKSVTLAGSPVPGAPIDQQPHWWAGRLEGTLAGILAAATGSLPEPLPVQLSKPSQPVSSVSTAVNQEPPGLPSAS